MSAMMTSGFRRCAASMSARPSRTMATISTSGCRKKVRLLATAAWSSASSNLDRLIASSNDMRSLSQNGHAYLQLGPPSVLASYFHVPGHQSDPLVDADQSQPATLLRLRHIETSTIVGDSQLQAVLLAAGQCDFHPVRVGMARRVVQRFLRHAIEAEGDVPGDLHHMLVGVEHDLYLSLTAEHGARPRQRPDEAHVPERSGMQLVRQMPDRLARGVRLIA